MVESIFYLGILCIIVHVFRNTYRAWRDDKNAREWVIKHTDRAVRK